MNKTLSEKVENWERELSGMECNGPSCNHETSEDHYIVSKDFIRNLLDTHNKQQSTEASFYCNWCEKEVNPKEVEMSIRATTGKAIFSHKTNHSLIIKIQKLLEGNDEK